MSLSSRRYEILLQNGTFLHFVQTANCFAQRSAIVTNLKFYSEKKGILPAVFSSRKQGRGRDLGEKGYDEKRTDPKKDRRACCSDMTLEEAEWPGFPSVNPATSESRSFFLLASLPPGHCRPAYIRPFLPARPCTSATINTHLTESVHTDAGTYAVRRCAFREKFTCQRTRAFNDKSY